MRLWFIGSEKLLGLYNHVHTRIEMSIPSREHQKCEYQAVLAVN